MKNRLSYFNTDFLKYQAEHKLIILIPWLASFLTGISAIEGLFLQDTFFIITCTLSTLIFFVASMLMRINKSLKITAWIMILNTLFLTNVVWFRFEGSKGAATVMVLMLMFCISLFFKNNEKFFALLLVLINLFLLLYVEYNFPYLIKSYESPLRRIIDVFITFSVCGIFIVMVVQGLLNSYLREKTKAEQVDKLKSSFITNISHEIRTPLNAILGFSLLIARPTTKKKECLIYSKFVSDACDNLVNLIDEVIEVAKIETNQLNVQKVKCNITELVEYVYQFMIKSPNKELSESVDFYINKSALEYDVFIETDPSLLKQVLLNLLDNAIKFTDHGFIEIGYYQRDSDILFFVKDTGIGIPEEDCLSVFDSFSKAFHKTDKLYRGVGLGLTLSKKILGLLNGSIWVKSTVNQGSTFYFTVPFNTLEVFPHKPCYC